MGPHHARRREHFVEKISDIVAGEEVTHESVWQCDNSKQMENRREEASEHEPACACVAARFPRGWLRHYVKSKLRRDPIFPAAYELLRGSDESILDVGCGIGLLAFYLRERGCAQPITGLDVDARKIRHARNAAADRYRDVSFHEQNAQEPFADFRGNVALFDVLHYLPLAEQSALLSRLTESIAP